MLRAVQSSVEEARARERNGVLTGGPAGGLDRSDGHGVNRHPRVGAVQLQQIKTGWPHRSNGQNRVNNKGRKLKKSPGNERGSEREGQPLGPLRIKAPLTLVGAPARIRKGDPRGSYRGTTMGRPNGRPIVGNSHLWGHRGRPEWKRDQLVPVTSKWTNDRWATRHRPPEDWTGKGGRVETFGRFQTPGNHNVRTRGVQEPVATPLSPLAESFYPRPTSEEQQPRSSYTDNGLDRSLARTGSSKVETTRNNIKRKIATIGKAGPIETGEPVAMADVAEPPGSAGTGAGGPVVAGTQFTAVADRTGASGLSRSETGEPVVTEMRIQTGIDVADASGPAATGAGDSVGVEKGLRPVSGIAGAGGLVVRSWPERGSWPLLMYMPHLKTEKTTHRAVLINLNRSQEQSRKLVGLPGPVGRPEPDPVVRSWPERGSWPLLMYMPHLKTEKTTHRAVLINLNRSQEQSQEVGPRTRTPM